MAVRNKRADPPAAPGPLQRSESWRGLRPHDEIRVRGKPGQRRRYQFLAFISNIDTGECYIEVVGGRVARDGSFQRNVRVFPPERCSPPSRRRRSAPASSAVQLRFGELIDGNSGGDGDDESG